MLIDDGTTKTSSQHAMSETGDLMLLMLNSRDAMQHIQGRAGPGRAGQDQAGQGRTRQGRAEYLVQKQHVCLCDQQGQDVLG